MTDPNDRDVVGDRTVPWERAEQPAWGAGEFSAPLTSDWSTRPDPVMTAWDEVLALYDRIADLPPLRTEPIKFTQAQWDQLRAVLPTEPAGLLTGQLRDLTGVPIVLVEDEAESTPVVEGWRP